MERHAEPNTYDPENPQEYIYDPEINNQWYWGNTDVQKML